MVIVQYRYIEMYTHDLFTYLKNCKMSGGTWYAVEALCYRPEGCGFNSQ
jgi:hypothetical protein